MGRGEEGGGQDGVLKPRDARVDGDRGGGDHLAVTVRVLVPSTRSISFDLTTLRLSIETEQV